VALLTHYVGTDERLARRSTLGQTEPAARRSRSANRDRKAAWLPKTGYRQGSEFTRHCQSSQDPQI